MNVQFRTLLLRGIFFRFEKWTRNYFGWRVKFERGGKEKKPALRGVVITSSCRWLQWCRFFVYHAVVPLLLFDVELVSVDCGLMVPPVTWAYFRLSSARLLRINEYEGLGIMAK